MNFEKIFTTSTTTKASHSSPGTIRQNNSLTFERPLSIFSYGTIKTEKDASNINDSTGLFPWGILLFDSSTGEYEVLEDMLTRENGKLKFDVEKKNFLGEQLTLKDLLNQIIKSKMLDNINEKYVKDGKEYVRPINVHLVACAGKYRPKIDLQFLPNTEKKFYQFVEKVVDDEIEVIKMTKMLQNNNADKEISELRKELSEYKQSLYRTKEKANIVPIRKVSKRLIKSLKMK